MYKNIYVPPTYLTQPFVYGHTALPLPIDLAELILEQLEPGDWTYLALHNGYNVEIVKVVGWLDNMFFVERGKDFTEEASFRPGSVVYSTATAAGIRDGATITPLSLTLAGAVHDADGKLTIDRVTFAGLDVESTPFIALQVAYGCCDA